ncbi:hypothetical protein HF995_05570 [Sanguibacter hominis ATCC BAA-789]|uniref:Uncharacterized protein n=1 Tax=Sanguibacter hominis ATCC BAA-789 TaxID=1312740 RepID=A0A9X5IRF2_9MICO|nr:hypothetical protein [Sanguibacter hominis]NKX92748.1 hypothetical protein [Sanguibacter hominis ATCC BAA-789]
MPTDGPRRPIPWRRLAGASLRTLVAILGAHLVLVGLFAATYAIPDAPIVRHVSADLAAGRLADVYPDNPLGGRLDGYTQCLSTTSGVLPTSSTTSLVDRMTMVPRGPGECEKLGAYFGNLATDGPFADPDRGEAFGYIRYWSGYSIVARPLLALGGIVAAQTGSAILLVGALAGLAHGVLRRAGGLAAAALVGTYVLTSNVTTTPLAYTMAVSESVALAGAALVLLVPRRWVVPAAAAAASAFVFVDLLTVPSTSWALTVFAVGLRAWSAWAAGRRTASPAGAVLTAAAGGAVAWCAGYGVSWASRWVYATAYVGVDGVVDDVLRTARFRIDGDTTFTGAAIELSDVPLGSLGKNLGYWAMTVGLWAAVVIVVALVVTVVLRRTDLRAGVAARGGWTTVAALAAPALLVVVWYEFLRNHSQIHAFFTHRSLGAATAILVAALVIGWRGAPRPASARAAGADRRDASTPDGAAARP